MREDASTDLVAAAIDKACGGPAVMLGDSTWDCEAAERAGVPTVGILTGGFCEGSRRTRARSGSPASCGSSSTLWREEMPFGHG